MKAWIGKSTKQIAPDELHKQMSAKVQTLLLHEHVTTICEYAAHVPVWARPAPLEPTQEDLYACFRTAISEASYDTNLEVAAMARAPPTKAHLLIKTKVHLLNRHNA